MKIFPIGHLDFILQKLHEQLWFKPLIAAVLSIAVVFVAKLSDDSPLNQIAPQISVDTIDKLLTIMASSMLVIATFAVGSMVSSYHSAVNNATPRSFGVVLSDDTSQFALSVYIGAFIFSIVALVATKLGYYNSGGRFVLFSGTLLVFSVVILTFIKWVHSIAHLGIMGPVIKRVEKESDRVLAKRRDAPTMGALPATNEPFPHIVRAREVGYIQELDVATLQTWAETYGARIRVAALPGTFATLGRPLLYIKHDAGWQTEFDETKLYDAFQIGDERSLFNDPRFGLIMLSEIASRALSPGINDPGTAIAVTCSLVRLLTHWNEPITNKANDSVLYHRVEVPELSIMDMLNDAFHGIARDGAGNVEVMIRLQKALHALSEFGNDGMAEAARHQARLALKRATIAIALEEDLAAVRQAADFAIRAEAP